MLACPSCNTRKKDQLPNRQKLAAVVTRNKSMSNSDSSIVRLEFRGYNENLLWQLRFPHAHQPTGWAWVNPQLMILDKVVQTYCITEGEG